MKFKGVTTIERVSDGQQREIPGTLIIPTYFRRPLVIATPLRYLPHSFSNGVTPFSTCQRRFPGNRAGSAEGSKAPAKS